MSKVLIEANVSGLVISEKSKELLNIPGNTVDLIIDAAVEEMMDLGKSFIDIVTNLNIGVVYSVVKVELLENTDLHRV